jgi:CBS domain-containing protein
MNIDLPVTSIMSQDPLRIGSKGRISELWEMLCTGRLHHVPVVDGERLVGIVSTLDVAKLGIAPQEDGELLARCFLDSRLSVENIMQRDVITVPSDGTIRDAARLLSAGGFHALPVVDAAERLVGIVTSTDLLAYMTGTARAPGADRRGDATPSRAASERNRQRGVPREAQLLAVLNAAEAYLHSGLAAREHALLEQAIEAARGSDDLML